MENIEIKIFEFIKGLGTILLYFFVSILTSYILADFINHENMIISSLAQIAVYAVLLLVLGLVYHKRLIHDFKNFKKEYLGVALKNWIIGLGVMYICNILVSSLAGGLATNEEANRNLFSSYPVSSILTMVFIGPLIEEITFRASFKKAFSKWYTFAIVTALIFGSFHISNFFVLLAQGEFNLSELAYLLPYSALGFFFAKAFYETDNIYTSYFAHMFHNGLCIIILIVLSLIGG